MMLQRGNLAARSRGSAAANANANAVAALQHHRPRRLRVRADAAGAADGAAATPSWLAPGAVRDPKRDDKFAFYQQNAQRDAQELRQPRPENAAGAFYVDHTCIDCSTCRWVAPDTFAGVGLQAAVTAQPTTREGRVAALQALLSCPTHSIHVRERAADELREAKAGLPRAWPTEAPGVYHCGWHSELSFGGAGWLLVRPEGGNILIDSPRYSAGLAERIEALGGVSWILLTHRDDVADHEKWASHFGAKRVIHAAEANAQQHTDACEVKLDGAGPWPFPDGDADLTIVHTPGHTSDHIVLFSARHKALFSGDHLSGLEVNGRPWRADDGRLFIFTEFNWYSMPEQLRSVQKLLDYDWLHVLPGHGVPARVADAAARLKAVSELMERHGGAAAVAAAPAAPASASSR